MRNSTATRNYDVRMTETPPETEVLAKPTRRKFTAAYKRKIVEEANKCEFGEQAALLRREGLYATQLKAWRKQYLEEGEKGLKAKKRGPKGASAESRELEKLRKENARLLKKIEHRDLIIEVQKKLSALFASEEEDS